MNTTTQKKQSSPINNELKEIKEHYNKCQTTMKELWNAFENKGGQVSWIGGMDDSSLLRAFLTYDIKALDECIEEYKVFLESMLVTQGIEEKLLQ